MFSCTHFQKNIDSIVRLIYGIDMARGHQKDRTGRKSAKRLIIIVAACIIVVTVVLVMSLSGRGSAVTFLDPNLEAAIREAIGKPAGNIYESDLETLTALDAPGQLESQTNIQDLSGLQYCSNLIDLNLELNIHISDLSPLSDLTNLTRLDLWHNQISDISPLDSLTNLTYLELGDNEISDISPLGNLTNLEYLYLYSNQIADITSVANLTNLTSLSLQYNQLDDISPLAKVTNLIALDLWNNQIADISPLANLTRLAHLYLPRNQISDISPLVDNEGISAGDELYLSGNPLSSDSVDIYIPQLQARGVTVSY